MPSPASAHNTSPIKVNAPKNGSNLRMADAHRAKNMVRANAPNTYQNGEPQGPIVDVMIPLRYCIVSIQIYIRETPPKQGFLDTTDYYTPARWQISLTFITP